MGFTIDGRSGRQKPVNAELNLVPYIDLLTCMVAFLLITAVWTQLASLSVSQKGPGTVIGSIITTPARMSRWSSTTTGST